ncbi:MAG: hypothetical protein IJV36_08390, partial [Prevotella sp.]|nr:hypothetical protein [Prevotella sp.]
RAMPWAGGFLAFQAVFAELAKVELVTNIYKKAAGSTTRNNLQPQAVGGASLPAATNRKRSLTY